VLAGIVALHFVAVAPATEVPLVGQCVAAVLAAAGLQRWWGPAPLPLWGRRLGPSLRLVGKLLLVAVAIVAVIVLAQLAAARLGGLRWTLRPSFRPASDQYLLWFTLAVLWAPLIEEPLYRGIVQARLHALVGRMPALLVSSMLFWVMHWVMRGQISSPHHLVAGILLGGVYARTRSLLAPIVLHALINVVIIVDNYVRTHHADALAQLYGWA